MAHGLTRARLRDRIAKRTGYPKKVVAHVLDAMLDEITAELMAQGEVHFRGLFRLETKIREVSLPDKKRLKRVVLGVKPVRSFRQKLNTLTPDLD